MERQIRAPRRTLVRSVVASLAIAGVLSACTSTATPTPTSSSSAPTTSSAEGLRGQSVSSLMCPTRFPTETPGLLQPIMGEVHEYVVCPTFASRGRPSDGVDIVPTDGKVFSFLDQALRSPDIAPVPGSPCPAMAQMPRVILVRTTVGDWAAHLPTDSCGFYRAVIVRALELSTTVPKPTSNGLVPADGRSPVAPICGAQSGPVVTFDVNPDTPMPRCAMVRRDQLIRVVNTTNRFGSPGAAITVTFAEYPPRELQVGQATTFDRPVGEYLAVGVHGVSISAYRGGGAQVWLK